MQLFQKNYQHPEAHAHTHADIRKIEHRKLHEQQIDVVHHLAVEHTVDQVADAAGKDQQQCGLLQVSAAAAEEQPVGHKDQRYAGSDDEEQLLAAEQAERHARVEHEPQLHHMGDQRHCTNGLQHICGPQLDGLIDANECRSREQIKNSKCHRILPKSFSIKNGAPRYKGAPPSKTIVFLINFRLPQRWRSVRTGWDVRHGCRWKKNTSSSARTFRRWHVQQQRPGLQQHLQRRLRP